MRPGSAVIRYTIPMAQDSRIPGEGHGRGGLGGSGTAFSAVWWTVACGWRRMSVNSVELTKGVRLRTSSICGLNMTVCQANKVRVVADSARCRRHGSFR